MMVKAWKSLLVLLGVWAFTARVPNIAVEAQVSGLSPSFYDTTCPQVFEIVAEGVWAAILNETRIAASLLRLHFHDCFVQGCDGSILLDDETATIPTEQTAPPNNNSVRGFNVIADIKAALESSCPGVVSCADIVALSSFFSVVLSGGPAWPIPLGRRDSFTAASLSTILDGLIAPTVNITVLEQKFYNQNLSTTDLVALSGGHTIGIGRCTFAIPRIYDFAGGVGGADPTMNTTLVQTLKANCPNTTDTAAINVPNPMDITTPTVFDNFYFQNLLEGNGLFQTDQEMLTVDGDTKALVVLYASNQTKFFEDFVQSMINMGNLNVLTGTNGEIRTNCSVRNPLSSIVQETVIVDSKRKSEKTESVEKTESAVEFFKQIVKKVVAGIRAKELEKMEEMIAKSFDGGHSST